MGNAFRTTLGVIAGVGLAAWVIVLLFSVVAPTDAKPLAVALAGALWLPALVALIAWLVVGGIGVELGRLGDRLTKRDDPA